MDVDANVSDSTAAVGVGNFLTLCCQKKAKVFYMAGDDGWKKQEEETLLRLKALGLKPEGQQPAPRYSGDRRRFINHFEHQKIPYHQALACHSNVSAHQDRVRLPSALWVSNPVRPSQLQVEPEAGFRAFKIIDHNHRVA